MKNKFIATAMCLLAVLFANAQQTEREYWVESMTRIAEPVLKNLSEGKLKERMPFRGGSKSELRRKASHLEAVGRTVNGIAPWLELGADDSPEGRLRAKYIDYTLRGLRNAVDSTSADYLVFGKRVTQTLVDAAFLSQGLLRARTQIWEKLDQKTQGNMIEELKRTRTVKPKESNWLLFASMVEAALLEFTGECDTTRMVYGVNKFLNNGWYKGDAWYGDGMEFHFDYYNSLVIHPLLTDVLQIMVKHGMRPQELMDIQLTRHARLADELERMITPDGYYPVVGRSITYRFGVFHGLSQAALMGILPENIAQSTMPALTAVLRNQIEAPNNFDENGWLNIGFAGKQPRMGEYYINTGSLYMCMSFFVPLGLRPDNPFWAGPHADWQSKQAWQGVDIGADHALRDSKKKVKKQAVISK